MHFQGAQQRHFSIFNESRMHCPLGVFRIGGDIHYNFAKTAPYSTLFYCSTKPIETISIGKLFIFRIEFSKAELITLTMLSRKQVVPVFNISAILTRAAA